MNKHWHNILKYTIFFRVYISLCIAYLHAHIPEELDQAIWSIFFYLIKFYMKQSYMRYESILYQTLLKNKKKDLILSFKRL